MVELLILLHSPTAAEEISAIGNAFSASIRAAMGPEALREAARGRYINGQIEADELERELERIEREFPSK